MESDRQTAPLVPRLLLDLLAQRPIDSTNLNNPELRDPERVEDEVANLTVLPAIHASTARENSSVYPHAQAERGGKAAFAQTAHIRCAPPTIHQHPRFIKPSARRPSLPPRLARCSRPNNQHARLTKQQIADKITATARCFRALREAPQQCQSGSTKAILHQVCSILYNAAYQCCQSEVTIADELDDSHSNIGGTGDQAYFALLVDAQDELQSLNSEVSQVQTKVTMEESITSELNSRLGQLDGDLEQLQLKHAQSTDNIEIERIAVHQLEHEYGTLLNQEQDMRHKCESLFSQVERQKTQLRDVRTKASYLEFISRVPMKKHLDEKKLRGQEEILLNVARQAEDENAKLEAELARLDAQVAAIELQYQQDFDKKSRLECELCEAQDDYERIETVCRRTQDCHTPRPTWDDIVYQTPELSRQKYEWEILDNSVDDYQGRRGSDSELGGAWMDAEEGNEEDHINAYKSKKHGDLSHLHSSESGKTKKLVKEMLHWIERLQKHCGVNLHLSRVRLLHSCRISRHTW